jgi:hypothetical protein
MEVYMPQWPGELLWQEHNLLVGPLIPGRSRVGSSRLKVGYGANNLPPLQNHGRGVI